MNKKQRKKLRDGLFASAGGALGVSLMGKPQFADDVFMLGAGMTGLGMLQDSVNGMYSKKQRKKSEKRYF